MMDIVVTVALSMGFGCVGYLLVILPLAEWLDRKIAKAKEDDHV